MPLKRCCFSAILKASQYRFFSMMPITVLAKCEASKPNSPTWENCASLSNCPIKVGFILANLTSEAMQVADLLY